MAVQMAEMRQAVRQAREAQRYWKENKQRLTAEWSAAWEAGQAPRTPGPPPSGFSLVPWLLMCLGALSDLVHGRTPCPWLGAPGLLVFDVLYVYVVFRAFHRHTREAASTRVALLLMALVAIALGLGYGGNWLLFLPLLGLAVGANVRGPRLGRTGVPLAVLSGAVAALHNGWSGINTAYATFLSTMVTAVILSLGEAVRELRAAREELARRAVEEERLRFSRDLHDLLGHTLSVIVVKSEAARRLAGRDIEAALEQISDIESVGRQALTEIREAVTGYREGCLSTELDRARSALTAAGIEPVVRRSGPPLAAQTEALLGWVVREAVTNAVRHSGADHCEITVAGGPERVRLTVADNGRGVVDHDGRAALDAGGRSAPDTTVRPGAAPGVGGTGLKGLTERLAAAGGTLRTGPAPLGGFMVTAELPTNVEETAPGPAPAEATLPDTSPDTAPAPAGGTAS
ncbi:two-component sensor histidine kinase [Streptomyces thermodiastaticus]|nr:two-component sensor histidine kinase [Streptomyces thermodiastaticus]